LETKALIKQLQHETESMKSNPLHSMSEVTLRDNMLLTVGVKYNHVIKDYQNIQNHFKFELKKKLARQITLINPGITEQETDQILETKEESQDILKDAILTVKSDPLLYCFLIILFKGKDPAEHIQNAYLVAADKYHDMKILEKSVESLQVLFVDLGYLAVRQGEQLDQIEYNVKNSREYVKQGNIAMEQATKTLISVQMKKVCIGLFVLIVVGLIVGLITARATGHLQTLH
jgi:t-SNARE complex subunit (syntaxin)